jgi:hypothetical protein
LHALLHALIVAQSAFIWHRTCDVIATQFSIQQTQYPTARNSTMTTTDKRTGAERRYDETELSRPRETQPTPSGES